MTWKDTKDDKKKQCCNERIKWWYLVCRWSKIFFLRACIKEDDVLTFLLLGSVLDHIFDRKKDVLFYPIFVFRRGMRNGTWRDLKLYLQNKGFVNISWIYAGTIPFQYLKTVFAIRYSTLSLTEANLFF